MGGTEHVLMGQQKDHHLADSTLGKKINSVANRRVATWRQMCHAVPPTQKIRPEEPRTVLTSVIIVIALMLMGQRREPSH